MSNLKQTQEQKLKLSARQVLHANLLQLNAQLLEQRILKEISENPVLELSSQESIHEDTKTDDDNMLLFNGTLKHAIGYSNNPKGNLRLSFSFNNRHQLHDKIADHDSVIRWNKILNDN